MHMFTYTYEKIVLNLEKSGELLGRISCKVSKIFCYFPAASRLAKYVGFILINIVIQVLLQKYEIMFFQLLQYQNRSGPVHEITFANN